MKNPERTNRISTEIVVDFYEKFPGSLTYIDERERLGQYILVFQKESDFDRHSAEIKKELENHGLNYYEHKSQLIVIVEE